MRSQPQSHKSFNYFSPVGFKNEIMASVYQCFSSFPNTCTHTSKSYQNINGDKCFTLEGLGTIACNLGAFLSYLKTYDIQIIFEVVWRWYHFEFVVSSHIGVIRVYQLGSIILDSPSCFGKLTTPTQNTLYRPLKI